MNRIEQVATPAPAQLPQPRRPRPLADVRRRAAQALHPTDPSASRARRGASGLAVAIAALAVPLVPSPALGAVSATKSTPEVPQSRHHSHHGHVVPDPGAVTVQAWSTASGWSLTVPNGVAEAELWDHVPRMPIDHPRPVVLPDGTHGEIAAYRVSHASPHADDPDASGTQDPGDPTGLPLGDAPPEWSSGGPSALRNARSRAVPDPLIQTDDVPRAALSQPSAPERAVEAVDSSASPCAIAAYPAGNDRYMLARLHPVKDPMDVVVTHHRTVCALRVDYLSQARA